MKQSSIDWLAEQHDKLVRWMEGDAKAQPYSFTDFDADLKIAREMHQKEIEEAYDKGFDDGQDDANGDGAFYDDKQHYYTQTFTPTHNQG